jgi:uncharacterized protein YcaQ
MGTRLDDIRRLAVTTSLFPPTTLARALDAFGFVQADPIRAPARAQDLILRHRVIGYRAGDLERRYTKLGVAEDTFINYGFVTHALQALMHPRPDVTVSAGGAQAWSAEEVKRARLVLRFVSERGPSHPREVDEHFAHGKVTNAWGGSSNATTQLLDALHYGGSLRVDRREGGVRIYAAHEHPPARMDDVDRRARLDALVDVVVGLYSPLTASSLAVYVRRLRHAAPQWRSEVTGALQRAKARLAHARIDGVDWVWATEPNRVNRASRARREPEERVYLLAPFDPVVHDRARFELLWGWVYRFEAYTPPAKRKLGYYALPLLFRDRVLGWANVTTNDGELEVQIGYVAGRPPRDRVFRSELDAEIERMRLFLRLPPQALPPM